ncbi:MAG: hypothetical protein IKL57_01005 [Oscillospiraceae bacterium]|nr:hypothetical protein [Oscillospiraceae bacterium]
MKVKYWFIRKQFEGLQKEFAQLIEPIVIRKSEKALLLEWNVPERGAFRCWVPKTAVEA